MLRRFSKTTDEHLRRNHQTRKPQGNQAPIETETITTVAEE